MDPWDFIAEDRRALADYLGALSPDEWNASSWCADWTVKDVAAHLLVSPTMSKGQIFFSFLSSGFNLDKMSAKLVRRLTAEMSTDQIVAATRDTAGVESAPPGLKPLGVLGEVLAHSSDISFAVGRPLSFPVEHYVVGLDYLKDAQPVLGCKQRIEGLGLKATDADWSTGGGPLVEGDVQHLLSAMAGRAGALAGLTGDGVEIMAGRHN
jgi:uncharacterized protein (TIGR03083 family)